MNSSNKMNNVLLVLLSASVIATIGTIFYHFVDTSYETETAIRATADESKYFEGVYVRDENVLSYSGTGAVSYQVPDGGKIAVNDVIAEVYPDESAIEKEQQIKVLQDKLNVLERISNPGTLEQAQPADLSRQISQYYEKIVQSRNSGDLTELSSAQQQFVESYSTYQIVISKGEVSFAQEISDLTAQIQALQSEQETPVDTVKSDSSAYFVSHVDGLESKLSIENLANITPEQIQEMLDLDLSTKEAVISRWKALDIDEDEKQAQISKCRITHIRTLEHVRDIFIVGCLTGQRVSDYSRICEDMITEIGGTEFILITQQKTEKKVYIPVDRRVRAILAKYDGKLPPVHSNEMNKLVKTIGLLLGWTHDCGFDEKRLNPKRGRRFCDMLLSHTARRSFATNAYKAGVPLPSIQAITGHSSEAQLRRYLKLDAEEKAVIALKDFKGIIKI